MTDASSDTGSFTIIQGQKQSGLVTLLERRSGYLLAARLPKFSAELTQKGIIRLVKHCYDKGGNRPHLLLLSLLLFGQLETNKNTNDTNRQYFPKAAS